MNDVNCDRVTSKKNVHEPPVLKNVHEPPVLKNVHEPPVFKNYDLFQILFTHSSYTAMV